LKSITSRKHLRANRLLLLQELVQTYKPKNVPEVIAFKTSEFWGNTKRFHSESIDDYYNRFHDLLDDLAETDEPISTKSAIGNSYSPLDRNLKPFKIIFAWEIYLANGKLRIGLHYSSFVGITTIPSNLKVSISVICPKYLLIGRLTRKRSNCGSLIRSNMQRILIQNS